MFNKIIGLDFETYSAVPLKKHGLHRYVSDSTFMPLIASLTFQYTHDLTFFRKRLDFTTRYDRVVEQLAEELEGMMIAAHNAPFEQRVLAAIGIDLPASCFIDSAMIARAMGAGSKLEAAAPQLLGVDKLEDGKRLMRLFSFPGKLQEEADCWAFDRRIVEDNPDDWKKYGEYCDLDSELGLRIVLQHLPDISDSELRNCGITMDMNNTGWPVDVAVVEEMQRRYLENQATALEEFRTTHDAADLNLNSLKQMKEWCAERGIKANSFDEKNVEKLMARIKKKLDSFDNGSATPKANQYEEYCEVLHLLETKQTLGGSSLKKLQTILDTTGKDCRLRDQYLHIGAGQTWRTTGVSVQMQNLKRLDDENIANMSELQDLDVLWDNDRLAENIRQCFTSSHPQGQLIVGDFKSVESRGLAWLAGDIDKLWAYQQGKDMYKVQATLIYPGLAYDAVTKSQRQTGKVGELSCGYGAGGGAVQAFAENMGVALTEGEATQLVSDWRTANPKTVELWAALDAALADVLDNAAICHIRVGPTSDYKIKLKQTWTPLSLMKQHQDAVSISMQLVDDAGEIVLTRYFHGCYRRGRDICYYKPSDRKTGDLWRNNYTDPKTKQLRFYNIYGGKLTGILTQSFCREIFFSVLQKIHTWVGGKPNLELIGQFHDEIVLDWIPGQITLQDAMMGMNHRMSDAGNIAGFPLEADIKHDYRYTK